MKERRGGAVKLTHIKGEVCWGWVSLLLLFSATEKRRIKLTYNIQIAMIKVNWKTVVKVIKFVATVITSVASTLAVQSCGSF